MLLIYPPARANTRLASWRTLVSVQTLAVTPEDPLLSSKRIRHTSISGYSPSFLKGISKMPRMWCHLLQALQEFNLLFSRAGASKVEDPVTGLGNTVLTLLALFFCFSFMVGAPFPSIQLLTIHITKRSLNPKLTWSFSGLSEMSFRLVEVRFLWVMAGLPARTMSTPVKATLSIQSEEHRGSGYSNTLPCTREVNVGNLRPWQAAFYDFTWHVGY